jgi:DtxR family transcriptional regulator, Mn-dependent transcriptional regulator
MAPPTPRASREYLAALFEMNEEGISLVQARLAEWMGVSRASVSEAVKRLTRDELVTVDGKILAFTKEGAELAETLVRRHRLAEHFLIRIMGLPWHLAHEEASGWERVISDEVERRIRDMVGDPPTCPHGNPIPGAAKPADTGSLEPLHEVAPDRTVVLRRLTEDLELSLDVMRFFEDSGLMPGATITVREVGPDGTLRLAVDGRPVALGVHLADHLWVSPVEVDAPRVGRHSSGVH